MSFFEIGCGEGRVLAYLVAKGVENFIGIDPDNVSSDAVPHPVAVHYRQLGVEAFLASGAEGQKFDRVLMIDVLEHFSVEETIQLFRSLRPSLSDAAKLLVRVPNSASPWGQQFHYGDLTHKSAYTPDSMRQLAKADLNVDRNLFIAGFALFMGLSVPAYFQSEAGQEESRSRDPLHPPLQAPADVLERGRPLDPEVLLDQRFVVQVRVPEHFRQDI